MGIFLKRYFTFRNYLFVAILISLVLTLFAKQYEYFFFDLWVTKQIQLIQNPVIVEVLKFTTWLGNIMPSIMSLIVVGGTIFIYGYKKESLVLVLSTLGAVAISESLKVLVLRPRPDMLLVHQVETFFRADSFPSGHVLFFMGFYGFLLFLAHLKLKKGLTKKLLEALLFGLIILVGISRIYLGSHWFSDVLGAYLIGSIWLYIMVLVYRKIAANRIK